MLKRLSFLLSIFLVIGVVLALGWFIRYRNTPAPQTDLPDQGNTFFPNSGNNTKPATSSLPGASSSITVRAPGEKPFGVVADQEVIAYYPYPDGSVIFIQPSGQIVRVMGTEGVVLSSLSVSDLSHADFSYDGKKIAVAFGNPLNRQLSVFDVEKKSWDPIFARPVSDPIWAPRDYRLVFLTTNTNNDQIITVVDTQPSTPKTQEILSLAAQDLTLGWKSDDELLISEKASAFSLGKLLSLQIKKGTLTSLIRDWPGLDVLWDTPSQTGVAFQANKNNVGGTMSLLGGTGIVSRNFSFVTLPEEKCFFGPGAAPVAPVVIATTTSSTASKRSVPVTRNLLFCAVPKDTSRFLANSLPDSYFQKEVMTDDGILSINLENGAVVDFSQPITEAVDATVIKTSGGYIYFINRYNNKLYRLIRN